MNTFEIEIKSLLGSAENTNELIRKMKEKDPNLVQHETHKQLNHYFIDGDLDKLFKKIEPFLKDDKKFENLKNIKNKIKDYTLRTRLADGKVILVFKTSINEEASANAKARLEFEWEIKNLTLDELDKIILDCGFKYQAKWSRERTNYKYRDVNVSIDKNAGYGYIAEFEKVVEDGSLVDQIKKELLESMEELSVTELPQARLERMFAHYNANWRDYYGTDRIFTIE
ncbi:MAG TPA: CYTH domain-containing protein [Candidatus Paceibacterota bacterium]